jgi:hypothetical protein
MHTAAPRHFPALLEPKPLPEPLGARAVRLARAAAAVHMAEVARIRLAPSARPAWSDQPAEPGASWQVAEGAD